MSEPTIYHHLMQEHGVDPRSPDSEAGMHGQHDGIHGRTWAYSDGSDHHFRWGAAPRAEGLPSVEDLAAAMWAERDRLDAGIGGFNEVLYQRAARAILADLSGRSIESEESDGR